MKTFMKIEGSKVTISQEKTIQGEWFVLDNGIRVRREPIRPESQIHLDIYGKQWRLI
jgi:hypothetical protein